MTGSATILRANALALPLPDASVDLIVTSPPYHALRSYRDAGEHYAGQIGSEATSGEWLDVMLDATREMMRVLKPSGSIFVNLGDRYVDKGLAGLPWRYALRCIDDLGLILRAEVIWSKPNGLPESVTDRVRRSHEQWFHFTTRPRYYAAVDEIREPQMHPNGTQGPGYSMRKRSAEGYGPKATHQYDAPNPLGKLPGSVWTVPTEPLTVPEHLGVDHFAAFPTEWPRRIILGWSPPGVCTGCGEGRRPMSLGTNVPRAVRSSESQAFAARASEGGRSGLSRDVRWMGNREVTITGYACACPDTTAPMTPAVVLDPFGGTGTVALVAKALGRHGISVDLSADYCRLAEWRTSDRGELAKAMRVPKPDPVSDDQLEMFA